MKYTLLQVIFVLIISLFIYSLFSPYFHYFHSEESKETGHEENLKSNYHELMSLLNNSLSFYSKDGIIIHKEHLVKDGKQLSSLVKIVKNKGDYSVSIKRKYLEWLAINKEGKKEICFSFLQNGSCSNITKSLNSSFKSMERTITNSDWVNRVFIKKYKTLYHANAFFSITKEEKNYTLGSCTEFVLIYSYKKLSIDELNNIRISPSSLLATAVNNITEKICIDKEGKIFYKELYYNLSLPHNETFELVYFNSTPPEIPFYNVSSEYSLTSLVRKAASFYSELKKCFSSTDDSCYRELAISSHLPSICENAKEPKKCLEPYALFLKDKKVCPYLEAYNLTLPDYCLNNTEKNIININQTTNKSIEG